MGPRKHSRNEEAFKKRGSRAQSTIEVLADILKIETEAVSRFQRLWKMSRTKRRER